MLEQVLIEYYPACLLCGRACLPDLGRDDQFFEGEVCERALPELPGDLEFASGTRFNEGRYEVTVR
jgi:hypothetical protein